MIEKIFGDGALPAAIAGAAGGLVRWLALREHWTDGIVAILVGGVSAVYLAPAILQIVGPVLSIVVDDINARQRLAAFLCGLAGVGIVGFIIDAIRGLAKTTKRSPKK